MTPTRPAQSLLEAILAIGVIMVATVSSTTLIVTTVSAGQSSEDRIVAANYAREGVEVIRDMRDSNWILRSQNIINNQLPVPATYTWEDNPSYINGGAADYQTLSPSSTIGSNDPKVNSFSLTFNGSTWSLKQAAAASVIAERTLSGKTYETQNCDTTGGATCASTKFSRLITIQNGVDAPASYPSVNYIIVTSTVTWDNHGTKTYVASERLYDWR